MRVAAIGRTELLFDSILQLAKRGHRIVLIITSTTSQYQYGKNEDDFEKLARELGTDFLVCEKISSPQVHELIQKTAPDIAISVNWKTIIPQEILDLFPHGILNAHAGDLPRFKGNAVRNWALVSGEEDIALTIHKMSTGLDAGPVLLKKRCPIQEDTTIGDLYRFVETTVPLLFTEAVDGLENGAITLQEQPTDPGLSLRCYPRLPVDSEIDWKEPAEQIDRLVRASSEPFTGAYSFIGTERITIWKAHVEIPEFGYLASPGQVVERRTGTGEVAIATGEGFLVIEEAGTGARGRTKPSRLIRTLRTRLGMPVTDEIVNLKREVEELKEEIRSLKESRQ